MGNKCPKCQSDNPDDTKFCGNCAAPLHPSEEIPPSHTKTLETPKEELTRGTTFANRYELIEELGKGGMGKVYKVFDTKIKEEVALKLLKSEICCDKKTIERFTNEIKFSRKIVHKNVCRMYDLNEEEGTHYITMEYVPGEDLKSFIRRSGQLTIGKSISIARQICEGLSEAHSAGVVHRDLKPGNIMIDKEGNARIMDFGIARSLKAEGITGEGVIIGTPEYMSPEQVEGKKADHRSDIYSLGVILYEMMTGKVPFEGDTSLSIALKHKTEIPKNPREVNAQIPENISRLILRCMEKKKEDRYQSVNELLNKLKQGKLDDLGVKKKGKLFKLFSVRRPKKKITEEKNILLKILKFRLRFRHLVYFLTIYGIISLISLINDDIYGRKLDKIKVEYDTYFRSLFPVQKHWLPKEWEIHECNSFNIYKKLFPFKIRRYEINVEGEYEHTDYKKLLSFNPPPGELTKIFRDIEYDDIQDIKRLIEQYGKFYKFDELFEGVRCNKFDCYKMIENYQYFFPSYISRYVRMIILKARIDFSEGDYESGLKKIQDTMILTLDLMLSSTSIYFIEEELIWFHMLYQELIPLFLCDDLNVNRNILKNLENLIYETLTKLDIELIYYKHYLSNGNYKQHYSYFYSNKFSYFLFKKLVYLKHGFSYNRLYYKNNLIDLHQELLKDLKNIHNFRDKSVYINNYFKKQEKESNYMARFPFKINLTRTFGKLTLILLTLKRYGINSLEFSDLKGREIFINELSGKGFEITQVDKESFIILDKKCKLSLKKIDYQKHHKEILGLFKHFNLGYIISEENIRSIFYSDE